MPQHKIRMAMYHKGRLNFASSMLEEISQRTLGTKMTMRAMLQSVPLMLKGASEPSIFAFLA